MILFLVSPWSEGREPVLVLAVMLGVGVAAVAAERFVSAALISAYCLVAAAERWSREALMVADATASASNWPSSSSSSPGVSPTAVGTDAGHYAVEALCCGGGSKNFRCIAGSGGIALEDQL